jgi:dinuclear metal center YbgI/SA1388 family protein
MTDLQTICDYLDEFAPLELAEDWDNVGLLVGDRLQAINRVMNCLTVTPASVGEAIRDKVDLIVTHHPLPFRPLKRLTTDSTPGRLLLALIGAGIAVYSPHTAFDSAASGVNRQLADGLGLIDIEPLAPKQTDSEGLGSGRRGILADPVTVSELAQRLKSFLSLGGLHIVGQLERTVQSVAVACGAAGEFLELVISQGCDALVLGETSFHTCLEAEANGVALLLPGHYASERFAVESLAQRIGTQFSELDVWASRDERDPLRWV